MTQYNALMQSYTSQEVAELDRHTMEDLGVDLKQLMEVAGLRSAEALIKLAPDARDVVCLVGPGGNGGDALVCSKWLKLWGLQPGVVLSHPEEELKPVTAHQLNVFQNYGGAVLVDPPARVDAIVDGIFGYSLSGNPRDRAGMLIEWTEGVDVPILALDCPSGLDASTGEPRNPCVVANHTIMYGVAKKGVVTKAAEEYVGTWEVVDIGFLRDFPGV